jgi:hypothetical protein
LKQHSDSKKRIAFPVKLFEGQDAAVAVPRECQRTRRHGRGDRHGVPASGEGGRCGVLLHRPGVGQTSLKLRVEAWVLRQRIGDRIRVTYADFTYVALDDAGQPRRCRPERQPDPQRWSENASAGRGKKSLVEQPPKADDAAR